MQIPFRGTIDLVREFIRRVYVVTDVTAEGSDEVTQLSVMDDIHLSMGTGEAGTVKYVSYVISQGSSY